MVISDKTFGLTSDVRLNVKLTQDALDSLPERHLCALVIDGRGVLSPAKARRLRRSVSISKMEVNGRADPTRAALNELVRIEGLCDLKIWGLRKGGSLMPFDDASALECLYNEDAFSEADFEAICRAPYLKALTSRGVRTTPRGLRAIAGSPKLRELDLEDSDLDARGARILARMTCLEKLEVGGSRIGRDGLEALTEMKRLRRLDIWATGVTAADLELLHRLPHLEWISIGAGWGGPNRETGVALDILFAHPSLKGIWLDDVPLNEDQIRKIQERFEETYATVEPDNPWTTGPTCWPLINKRAKSDMANSN